MDTKKSIDVLNGLVEINNDRMEGYDRASKETSEGDLKSLFSQHAATSRRFKEELVTQVRSLGGEAAKGTTASGKIYRAWMDVRSGLSTNDRKTVLKLCEFGEDAAVKEYESALKDANDLTSDHRSLISRQHSTIKAEHDKVRDLRDAVIASS